MSEVLCDNPHWVGCIPAWDITLSNGIKHTSVTKIDISKALGELSRNGVISLYSSYIDVVRDCHIKLYDKYHTEKK